MSTETGGPDPYALVISDLRAKRAQIDQTIKLLEGLRSGATPATPAAEIAEAPAHHEPVGPGNYLGMSIVDAAKKALASRRQALGNAEIHAMLKAGGLHMNSVDPLNTIGSVLTRRFNQVGDVVKVGRGVWGLKEWYPNRTFKTPTKTPNGGQAEPVEQSPTSETISREQLFSRGGDVDLD
jgi:hypothetical protein